MRARDLMIGLDFDFAKKISEKKIAGKDWTRFRKRTKNIYNSGKIDFIGDSPLVWSVGFDAASSCTLYMNRRHYEFFLGENLESDFPSALGAKGKVLYVSHNADTEYNDEILFRLWGAWFNGVKELV